MNIIKQFLEEWLEWAEAGAPNDKFYKDCGLCGNLENWYDERNMDVIGVYKEFEEMLGEVSGCLSYPFGMEDYDKRWMNNTQHECPKRLAWVRATIDKLS